MPVCEVCHNEYQRVGRFCPNCGAPLTALAARLREAQRRPVAPAPSDTVVLPDLEDAEAES
jgi:predicted amidophosphoribosyltransferase